MGSVTIPGTPYSAQVVGVNCTESLVASTQPGLERGVGEEALQSERSEASDGKLEGLFVVKLYSCEAHDQPLVGSTGGLAAWQLGSWAAGAAWRSLEGGCGQNQLTRTNQDVRIGRYLGKVGT